MANVIDIKTIDIGKVKTNAVFAIDTNALIWTHYSKASNPNLKIHPYQVFEYPNFINKILSNGNKVITTNLNISEMCGVVEKNEFRIYKALNGIKKMSIKDYRKIATERTMYKKELDTMIMEIESAYDKQIEIVKVDEKVISSFQANICTNTCDIFDYAIIEHLKCIGVNNFISDDKDFASIEGIELYTAYGD